MMPFSLTERATVLFFFRYCAGHGYASPADDLASPSQEKRDAAAKEIRRAYAPPSRSKWDSLIAEFRLGMPQTNVLKQIRSHKLDFEGGIGSGTSETRFARLDDR